jgi:putative ABC transport system permease protein
VTLFISSIGAVSLIVGAIGIANIMLVSVTERTREIGVMKAIGAKDREILVLFLLEAILIGLIGSLFGIALGFAGGAGVVKSSEARTCRWSSRTTGSDTHSSWASASA